MLLNLLDDIGIHLCSPRTAFIVLKIQNKKSGLTLNAPITTKVVCFSRLLKCLRSLYGKLCDPRSDCSYRSSLFWVHAVCFYTRFISNARQLFAADDFSRRHFQLHFFLGALRVKIRTISKAIVSYICNVSLLVNVLYTQLYYFPLPEVSSRDLA